ncbi:hypothetical protein EMIHUDRAFT_221679 [Emiliania huxleyi CCMP1516]|uniref:Uncharacterized protein n=2 Tax=Emiliania huxleyi TaxID=2903 RepID=A0A0D3HY09_EMIH1|nr:hypothetical protein EMIHUDRAFT_221679 [Emiliania huxleyi CCMP1516]EOD03894.1 hypothetical protein EMIHUDRAFT_221679 [Emiliania huxleyi CCMP1516]|eukprot:XP_005756323.1 hypothetical protein EMIHUDRAFT_221679 [Emiliania huxleyi CCMP1516]
MLRNVAVLALATIAAGFGPAAIIREPDDALDQTMCAEPDAPAETIGPILAEFLRPDLLSCNQVGTAIFDSVYSGEELYRRNDLQAVLRQPDKLHHCTACITACAAQPAIYAATSKRASSEVLVNFASRQQLGLATMELDRVADRIADRILARLPAGRQARVVPKSSGQLRLTVMIVYFGPLPPWMPITLHSMAENADVRFVIVGDSSAPAATPKNVHFEHITFEAMQKRLAEMLPPSLGRHVLYNDTYKANDIKPFLPHLYSHLLQGQDWWAWADLDVIFGDLLKYLTLAMRAPACCVGPERCIGRSASAEANVVCPFFPNPPASKAWGPFTAFSTALGPYADAPHLWMLMGGVLNRLAEGEGRVTMSKLKIPFGEAKTCVDIGCVHCPCGAVRARLHGGALLVNGREVMLLHLSQSKSAWSALQPAVPPWAPGSSGEWAEDCIDIAGLGTLSPRGVTFAKGRYGQNSSIAVRAATRLQRHRVKAPYGKYIHYGPGASNIRLRFGPCGEDN